MRPWKAAGTVVSSGTVTSAGRVSVSVRRRAEVSRAGSSEPSTRDGAGSLKHRVQNASS